MILPLLLLLAAGPRSDVRAAHLAQLEAMGRKCGYRRSGWELLGTIGLRIQPHPHERFEALECMLREIDRSRVRFKVGFVGNEAYAPGKGS
ncbi:MAG: hypothetical protein QOJ94_3175 [Sphingomonadales bacterium]|jgi:hypothetical protein|nr:hypothetical protein [Sphingomonadales bacterium]